VYEVRMVAEARRKTEGADEPGRVARRRARVRHRILEAAEALMLERGVEAVTIDEITDAADIARRSFYHYFEGKNDVLVPIARARTRALNQKVDRIVAKLDDPAEVMATAMRHALRALGADPLCSWFVLHSGLPQERLQEGLGESGMRDAMRGIESGRFRVANPEVLRLVLSGGFISVLSAYVDGKLDDGDLDDAVESFLRLLGIDLDEAHEISHRPLRRMRRSAA
jgi:AcrR family transcriptional regulator